MFCFILLCFFSEFTGVLRSVLTLIISKVDLEHDRFELLAMHKSVMLSWFTILLFYVLAAVRMLELNNNKLTDSPCWDRLHGILGADPP